MNLNDCWRASLANYSRVINIKLKELFELSSLHYTLCNKEGEYQSNACVILKRIGRNIAWVYF